MPKPPKQLLDKWYGKLAKDGFKDIEDVNSPYESLKVWDSWKWLKQYTPDQIAERQTYFNNCEEVLRSYAFESATDRAVWQLHSDGFSMREIAKKLTRGRRRVSYSKAFKIIKKIKKVLNWKR